MISLRRATPAMAPAPQRARRDGEPPPPERPRRAMLAPIVFVVGASSLGAEIAAARLLAPYFGASTIVWANTIAVVLIALSGGYWLGGWLADRAPSLTRLCLIVELAAVLLAAVPLVARPLLDLAVGAVDQASAGAFVGSLLGVLLLVAPPVLLLGTVAPYAIRLSLRDVDHSGRVAGRLYAISTLGSLVGTFLAALALVPFVGTRRTFLSYALALAVVAAPALPRRYLAIPLVITALILLQPGPIKGASDFGRVIYETETPYQYARVVEAPDGSRRLELNEGVAVHSLYRPRSYLTDDYWDDFLVLPLAIRRVPPRRIAILGNGAGTTARAYGHYFPRTTVEAVELDGRLTEVGRRYFGLRGPHLRTVTADARPFLRRTRHRYDAIFVDSYRQPYIPFYLATREFFELCRDRLTPGGVVIVNVGHPEGSAKLDRVLGATMGAAFPSVARDPVEPTNTLLVATAGGISAARLRAAAPTLPRELRPIAATAASHLTPRLSGGEVYTDDRAPVEWLIDRSIVRYAAAGR